MADSAKYQLFIQSPPPFTVGISSNTNHKDIRYMLTLLGMPDTVASALKLAECRSVLNMISYGLDFRRYRATFLVLVSIYEATPSTRHHLSGSPQNSTIEVHIRDYLDKVRKAVERLELAVEATQGQDPTPRGQGREHAEKQGQPRGPAPVRAFNFLTRKAEEKFGISLSPTRRSALRNNIEGQVAEKDSPSPIGRSPRHTPLGLGPPAFDIGLPRTTPTSSPLPGHDMSAIDDAMDILTARETQRIRSVKRRRENQTPEFEEQ
ncbi:hypothetical protein BJ166DRAFT_130404 [Pestalotiopsis sp. NC0098]|nr:hypothetical protein BJ166DRAFT_130404 [Pestalotiopsis sp. NC0098]